MGCWGSSSGGATRREGWAGWAREAEGGGVGAGRARGGGVGSVAAGRGGETAGAVPRGGGGYCGLGGGWNGPRVTFVGLSGSGKTSVIRALTRGDQAGRDVRTISAEPPTDRVQRIALPGRVVAVDTSGSLAGRRAWAGEIASSAGVVFVVDSSDRARLPLVCDLLHYVSELSSSHGCAVAVLAHKQDAPGSMSPEELSATLSLESAPAVVRVLPTSISQLEGLKSALRWVLDGTRAGETI